MAVMSAILIVNLVFIAVFYKELKLATFDAGLAAAIGFSPVIINYVLMALVSITAVGAFDAVGSILVVAFMVGPPAAAYLLTDRLKIMLLLSAVVGIICAVSGYWAAHFLDVSIAGSMAGLIGVIFGLVLLIAPHRGLIAVARRRARQKMEFPQLMLAFHLSHHSGQPEEIEESRIESLHHHMHWEPAFTKLIVDLARRNGLVVESDGHLILTEKGKETAQKVMAL
jgi:manganese/zinc/iron transport system permease protein